MSKPRTSSPRLEQRKRWNLQQARQILASVDASGKTVEAYADEHGLRAGRISLWQRRLSAAQEQRVDFHEVQQPSQPVNVAKETFDVLLPSGVVLRFGTMVAVERVAAIVRGLS